MSQEPTDIVTRLRGECQCSDDCRAVGDPCIPMRAADEIERLRAEVEHLLHLWKVLMATVKAEEFANGKWIRGEIGAEELNLVATDRANAFNAFDKAVRGE